MKKIIFILSLVFAIISNVQSAEVASRWDSLTWSNSNPVSLISNYDVAFTASNVTAANLGSNSNINNAISTFKVIGGNNTLIGLTNVIPSAQMVGSYNLFVRCIDTNSLYSPWSTPLVITYVVPPAPPTVLKIIRVP